MDNQIKSARDFAIQAHGNQKYGDRPYSRHLQDVVNVLASFKVTDPHVLMAGWLHDVLEDTETTLGNLDVRFPPEVVTLVWAITDEPGANRKERKLKTYPKIRAAGRNAVMVKLADRIANTAVSLQTGGPLLKMYRREFPEFSTALFVSGECDAMWDHLRRISTEGKANG